jgi:tripartite-type tricarboxylate transporter receptor subunit TctC
MPSRILIIIGVLVLVSGIQSADADEFPSRAIRIIVPYAAGGPSDVGTR